MDYSNLTKAELIEKLEEKKHLASAVEHKDNRIAQILTELEELKKSSKDSVKKEDFIKRVKELEEERNYALEIANLYLQAHQDLLKQTQQNLEMAVFTEGLISQKIRKTRGE